MKVKIEKDIIRHLSFIQDPPTSWGLHYQQVVFLTNKIFRVHKEYRKEPTKHFELNACKVPPNSKLVAVIRSAVFDKVVAC